MVVRSEIPSSDSGESVVLRLSYSDSCGCNFKYVQIGALFIASFTKLGVAVKKKCSVREMMPCSLFVMLQIGIGVIAALIVLMILTMFGLWYKNRKYV